MNKEVKDLIEPYNPNIKKGTWYVTSSTRDVKKPYLVARLEELNEKNKLLQQKVNQLEEKEELHLNRIDELTDRVVKFQEKISQLKKDKLCLAKKLNQLETNIDEAIEYIKEHIHFYENNSNKPKFVDFDESARPKILIEILERGKE